MTTAKSIVGFWQSFQRNAAALAQISSADEPVYDELLGELQRIDAGLFFEFSAEPGDCELIITAEGNRALFALVDEVVAAAPRVNGWKVFGLKPKVGFPESVEWEGDEVNIVDVFFEPLLEKDSDDLGLLLLVPGLTAEQVENIHNGLLRAIDHALGERQFAEAIQYTNIASLDEPADEYIPLVELEGFIEWRNSKRKQS